MLFRERAFDAVGAKDLADYRSRRADAAFVDGRAAASSVAPPLPRLVVIIDEFAALASELAEEIGALTDLTARGRSLGVHLLLATQKPSTAVNSDIRANTRLRISLQVEDKQDSLDVVGVPDAAAVRQKGRGLFRVGSSEIVPIQTALASGHTAGRERGAVDVASFVFGAEPKGAALFASAAVSSRAALTTGAAPDPEAAAVPPTDLVRLVRAIDEAFVASEAARPRRPWPDPLPSWFPLGDLPAIADSPSPVADPTLIPFLLADDPAAQTRYPTGWSLAGGNLLIYGVVGSGTTTALTSLALAFASSRPADEGHLYAMDFGTGGLAALAGLPHCGDVIPATDRERHIRLVRMLREELQRRRQLPNTALEREPTIVLLIDNVEAFRAEFDDAYGLNVVDQVIRLFSEGPDAGVYVAATANRVGGIPPALSAATPQKLVMRLADVGDYGSFSIPRRALPTFLPGRGLLVAHTQVVQVASPAPDLPSAVNAIAAAAQPATAARPGTQPADRPPQAVGILPADIDLGGLPVGNVTDEEWRLPIGVSDADLSPASLVLYEQEHAVVGGAARSGKSTALLTVAAALRRARPNATVIGIACRRSPLRGHPAIDKLATSVEEIPGLVDTALVAAGPTLLLVDDAEGIDDGDGRLAQLLTMGRRNVHLAIAGRADVLRTQYGHWTQTVRRSKAGLLLNPNLDLDADLLGTRLPSRLHTQMMQGRGFLVGDGRAEVVQVARERPRGAQ